MSNFFNDPLKWSKYLVGSRSRYIVTLSICFLCFLGVLISMSESPVKSGDIFLIILSSVAIHGIIASRGLLLLFSPSLISNGTPLKMSERSKYVAGSQSRYIATLSICFLCILGALIQHLSLPLIQAKFFLIVLSLVAIYGVIICRGLVLLLDPSLRSNKLPLEKSEKINLLFVFSFLFFYLYRCIQQFLEVL